jgi:hypothetical protein
MTYNINCLRISKLQSHNNKLNIKTNIAAINEAIKNSNNPVLSVFSTFLFTNFSN